MDRDTVALWLMSVQDKLLDILERFAESSRILFGVYSSGVRWILIVGGGFILGALWRFEIQQRYSSNQLLDLQAWLSIWPLFLFTVAYTLPIIWQKIDSIRNQHKDRLSSALRWFYEDMKFGDKQDPDIRCTIWIPSTNWMSKFNGDDSPKRMEQVVDYYPSKGRLRGRRTFRSNKRAGRVFQVSRNSKEGEEPIGILGFSVVESLTNHKSEIYYERVPDNANFNDYMFRNWNFLPRHAKRLTADRRSYLCISMLDRGNSKLLGVLYCDSRDPEGLDRRIGERAQNYLPRFADLLTG